MKKLVLVMVGLLMLGIVVLVAYGFAWVPRHVVGPASEAKAASPESVPAADAQRAADALRAAVLGGPDAPALTSEAARERLSYLLDQFSSLHRELPGDTFDPKAVVDTIGRDPGALFAWVRDNTFWVPYRGVLRGPVGVLMDRVGSSLDRSLLLAEMLRVAGHNARLAHAELTPEQAQALLGRMRPVPSSTERVPQTPPPFVTRSEQLLGEYSRRFQKDPAALVQAATRLRQARDADAADARRRAAEHAKVLLAALGESKDGGQDARALEAAADHWWVRYQRDGQWIDCDPAVPGAPEGQALAPAQTTMAAAGVREENYWHVGIRVVIERWSQGRLSEETVLNHRIRVPDGLQKDIVLTHAPLTFPSNFRVSAADPADGLRQAVLGVHEWIPTLTVGGNAIRRAGVRDDGTVSPRPGAKSQDGGGMAGLFGGLTGDQPSAAGNSVLSAEWIDYEIQGPGAASHVRRESFDLVGPAARARGGLQQPSLTDAQRLQRGLALLGQIAILVQPAAPSQQFLAHRQLARFVESRNRVLALAQSATPNAEQTRKVMASLSPRSDVLWTYAAARFDGSGTGADVFLDAPTIATLRSSVAVAADQRVVGRDVFDVVSNEVGVRQRPGQQPFAARIEQGIADTVAETTIFDVPPEAANTAAVFGAAAAAGIQPLVVRAPGDGWAVPADMPADVVVRIRADLGERCHLVLPARSVTMAGVPRVGWWRVSADRGTVIGVMDTGFRQGLVERAIQEVKENAIPVVVTSIVLDWVDEHTPSNSRILSFLGDVFVYLGNAMQNEAQRQRAHEGR